MPPTGLEQIRAIKDGRFPLPSIQDTLGFSLHTVDEGHVTFRYEPDGRALNPMGTVHGGVAMTLLDSCMGASVHTTLEPGRVYGTLEIKVNLVRPVQPGGPALLAHGEVVHRGSRVATAQGRLVGEGDGKLYAHGTCTCMITGVASE